MVRAAVQARWRPAPQPEQAREVGNQQLMATTPPPCCLTSHSSKVLNNRHPVSAIAPDSLWFFAIPDTFGSSGTTVRF